MVLAPHSAEDELAMFKKIASARHVSGLIISRTYSNDPRFRILQDLDIPFVSHGRSSDSQNAAWLDVDNERAFAQMTAHLASLGHRRIAHIGGAPVYTSPASAPMDGNAACGKPALSCSPDMLKRPSSA